MVWERVGDSDLAAKGAKFFFLFYMEDLAYHVSNELSQATGIEVRDR